MTLTKNALGNLINRYEAVLEKCRLCNAFGSLKEAAAKMARGGAKLVAAGLLGAALLGGGMVWADDIDYYRENDHVDGLPGRTDTVLPGGEVKGTGTSLPDVN